MATNPETGTTTQGETVEGALANLREATELYLEESPMESYGSPLVTTIEVRSRAAWPAACIRPSNMSCS